MSKLGAKITTGQALAALPDGTVVGSAGDCGWPLRYAGKHWEKRGDSIRPTYGSPGGSCFIAHFKDPMPVYVVSLPSQEEA